MSDPRSSQNPAFPGLNSTAAGHGSPAAVDADVALLRSMFDAAVSAALPERCLEGHLPDPPRGRTIVVGAGKASAAMAAAFEKLWTGPVEGLVVTRYDHAVPTRQVEIVEASHPVPDAAGHAAAARMLKLVQGLSSDDLVVCLISGGGSALLAMPGEGLTLEDKQAVNKALLRSGATITEMNCVRKHLSDIKGGRLAAACAPAKVVTLTISDVPGDDPSVIASGPTVPDATSCADALAILKKYDIREPRAAIAYIESLRHESPKPGDPRLAGIETRMIATPQMSLEAAAKVARDAGLTPLILGSALEGEAKDLGLVHAGIVRQILEFGQPVGAPCVLLSGGEATVTVRGDAGRGGRCVEFLLSLTTALNGCPGVHAIACDTDGIDGTENNAGAWAGPDTIRVAEAKGVRARDHLERHDAYTFFEHVGQLVISGPTLTNVNDFRAIIVRPAPGDTSGI